MSFDPSSQIETHSEIHREIHSEIRNAPEVEIRSGRSRLNLGLIAALYSLAIIQLLFWASTSPHVEWRFLAMFVVTHSALLIGVIGFPLSSRASIRWVPSEEVWLIQRDRLDRPEAVASTRQISRLCVCLDLCNSILLRVEDGMLPGQRGHWLWFARSDAPGEWKSFRRALYSPATSRLFIRSPKVSIA